MAEFELDLPTGTITERFRPGDVDEKGRPYCFNADGSPVIMADGSHAVAELETQNEMQP